ncbi:MAG: ATP-dependent Clp protease adaptor ClpS [Verrucomicrobiales bacterium]
MSLPRNFRDPVASMRTGSPATAPQVAEALPDVEPLYHVVLHDDDDHTYDYVIEMLRAIFGYDLDKAYAMTREVDMAGRVIVATVHKELAELRVEQIQEYGPDSRMRHSPGSMKASMEPAE